MFRATLCSSSGGQIVLIQHLVLYCLLVTVLCAGWEGIIIIIIIIIIKNDLYNVILHQVAHLPRVNTRMHGQQNVKFLGINVSRAK